MSKDQFCEWLDGFLINIEADKKASLDYDIANLTLEDACAILQADRFADRWGHIKKTTLEVHGVGNDPISYLAYVVQVDVLESPASV